MYVPSLFEDFCIDNVEEFLNFSTIIWEKLLKSFRKYTGTYVSLISFFGKSY